MLTSLRVEKHYCAQIPAVIIRPVDSELSPYQGLWSDSCSDIKPAIGSSHLSKAQLTRYGSRGVRVVANAHSRNCCLSGRTDRKKDRCSARSGCVVAADGGCGTASGSCSALRTADFGLLLVLQAVAFADFAS